MSTIVASIDKETGAVVMGCESQTTSAGLGIYRDRSKIFFKAKGSMLIGSVGACLYGQIVEHDLKIGIQTNGDAASHIRLVAKKLRKLCTKLEIEEENRGELLIGYKGQVFTIGKDFNVGEYIEYYALGSGWRLALGSLYTSNFINSKLDTEIKVKIAIQSSVNYDIYSSGDVKILTLNK